ncbi:hypothetical protein [Embleya scabrispora]|uniref:hypothetical protein n=1 Tax=Embleya scabrispora TaxID=159449 RepID=UPI000367A2FF|nr:hypothetical protein [Embleya scabrispora]MYS82435.1 hypothetical protein [Streptomyces sp. SID5474]
MTVPDERPLDPVAAADVRPAGEDADEVPPGERIFDPNQVDEGWPDEEFASLDAATTVIVNFNGTTGNHVFGSRMFGDMSVTAGPGTVSRPRQAREGPIWKEESDLVCRTFVPPKGYLRARSMMARHLILLTGEAESGKRTLALHLMQDQYVEKVIALDPEEDLMTRRIQRGRGYVIDSAAADLLAGYSRNDLEMLRRRLAERDSVLVVTAIATAPVLALWAPWHVPCERPDPLQVLHSHLAYHLGPDWERRHLDLVDEDIAELVRADGGRPDRAATIAGDLADLADGRFTRTEVLNALRDRDHAAVEGWLRANSGRADWALMIAAAVFEGQDYGIVTERAAALRETLAEHLPIADGEPADGWPPRARAARLELINATAVAADATRGGARYRLDVVGFNRPHWAASVRAHVWDVYPDLRDPLVDWLAATPRHPLDVYRVAARAAGDFIATGRGHRPLAPVLRWAREDDTKRAMVVPALKAAAQDAVVATQVRHLLASWSRDTTRSGLRLMAARAYPGLASVYPGRTLTDLLRLARTGDRSVAAAAREGIVALCRDGMRAESVLERVEDWEEAAAAAEVAAALVGEDAGGELLTDERFLAVIRLAVRDRNGYAVVARMFGTLLGGIRGDRERAAALRETFALLFTPGRGYGLERLAYDLTRLAYEGLPNGDVIDIAVLEPAINAFEEPPVQTNGGASA